MAINWIETRTMVMKWIKKAGACLLEKIQTAKQETRWGVLFVLLMIVAFALRSPFLSKGHEDEYHTIGRSLKMIFTGDLDPHSYVYPTGPMYFTGIADVVALASMSRDVGGKLGSGTSPLELIRKAHSNPLLVSLYKTQNVDKTWDLFRYRVRIINLLLIPLIILLFYYIAVRLQLYLPLFGAGLLLAFCNANIQDSIYVSVNSITGLFCLLAIAWMVFCSTLPKPGSIGSWLLRICVLSFLIGLSTACKYNAGVYILLPLIYGWLSLRDSSTVVSYLPEKVVLLFLVTCIFLMLGFTALCPYWFKNLPVFLRDVLYEVWHYKTGHASYNTFQPGLQMAWINLQCMADQYSWIGVITTFICIGYLIWQKFTAIEEYKQYSMILIPVFFSSLAFFLLMSSQAVFFSRNFSIMWPGWFFCSAASWWFASGLFAKKWNFANPHKIQFYFTLAVILICIIKAGFLDPYLFSNSREWWRKNDDVLNAFSHWGGYFFHASDSAYRVF